MEGGGPKDIEKTLQGMIEYFKKQIEDPNWQENGKDGSAKLYKMMVGENMSAKGISVVNYPMDKIIPFLKRPDCQTRVDENTKNFQVLYTEPSGKYEIFWMEYKSPWPVANREFVIVTQEAQSDDTFINCVRSCNYPKQLVKGNVLGEIFIGGWLVKKIDDKSTEVTYLIHSDPRGSIPGVVKNTVASKLGGVASKLQPAMKKFGI